MSLHWSLWYKWNILIDICLLQKMLRFFKVEDRTLKRHISIGVFVVYIDTGSSVPGVPSKSRDLADENYKILTEWKWFETTVLRTDNTLVTLIMLLLLKIRWRVTWLRLRQREHICGNLWHRYYLQLFINEVMMAIAKLSTKTMTST